MMENRSFDHVLGYRAQSPGGEDSDGLIRIDGISESLAFRFAVQSATVENHTERLGFKDEIPRVCWARTGRCD